MDFAATAAAVPLDALKPTAAAPSPAASLSADKIKSVASKFEASFLSVMIGSMFEGVSTSAPFGGGEGEAAFKSFMTEAMAKSMVRHGGIGLAPTLNAALLKLQGAS